MLREVAGVPLVIRVYKAVQSSSGLDDLIVATDSEEIIDACQRHGVHAQLTSGTHRSGTERVHEISTHVAADVYLNIQGDEPLVTTNHIATLIQLMSDPTVDVGTLKTPAAPVDVNNPNAVKVVTNDAGKALYFSRSTIPHDRDGTHPAYFKHLGFYAYRKIALDRFVKLPESFLERSERLEQLRFLENGIDIHVRETADDTIGIDTEDDLQRVEEILRTKS